MVALVGKASEKGVLYGVVCSAYIEHGHGSEVVKHRATLS
jgi:hypothetical protein